MWQALRHVERLLAILGGILAIYLGYLLFIRGLDKGDTSFQWGKFIVSGQGPGIVLFAGGVAILITALVVQMQIKRSGEDQVVILSDREAEPDPTNPSIQDRV